MNPEPLAPHRSHVYSTRMHLTNDVGDTSSQAGRALRDIVDTSCESGTPGTTSVTRRVNPEPLARHRHLTNDVGDTSSQAGRALRNIVDTSCESGTPGATSVARRMNPEPLARHRAQSESTKDKKQGMLMSSNGPSYMKRTPFLIRPQRTIALLLLS
ncbi:unnamed protein product [Heligmosomoides polygyrus]|uniref:Uncharacterized protein n=1 Tax=Heligmosomoides polygyrus TaxID=6339 RepID=A0A3P8B7A5_HELPZ|nr:unnamed protein product [Heligmosomoides polygyrus]